MITTYRFTVAGNGNNGNTFEINGTVSCDWPDVFDAVMQTSFDQLTQGKARFGEPGRGCTGPYGMRRMVIEELPQ